MNLSQKNIVFFLILTAFISLGFKLYLVDFSNPVYSDNLDYVLYAIAHTNGDFSQSSHRGMGWSLFMFPFFKLIDSDDFLDYSNVARILSLSIATFTILPVYLLGRKFFDEKYSLVVASLFAFEPHLNYNSGFGLSEPLYHLAIIGTFYFVLNKNTKYILPSLLLAGIVWWIRINGFAVFIAITIIYFIIYRKSLNRFRNYTLGVVIFLIVVSPMLLQKYEQFGDPFYTDYNDRLFTGSYEKIVSANIQNETSPLEYINKNGIISFISTFILNGIYNTLFSLATISFPYLFLILPFGILFSLRTFDQNPKRIKANWIFMLSSLTVVILPMSVISEKRFLYYLYPFLIIISTITIQRVVEYGLSTFSFTKKQKNVFLIIVIIIVIILSGLFTLRYEKPDLVLEHEKMEFAKFAINNFNGKILNEAGRALDYINYFLIDSPSGNFKNYKINSSLQSYRELIGEENTFERIFIYGESVNELIANGEKFGLRYIISNENKGYFHPFIDDAYVNEKQYPYLVKVFDSNEHGFEKLKLKVFEIDYEKFHSSIP
jgi:hypothetical protein